VKKASCLIFVLLAFFLMACSMEPIYYSKDYVKRYVKNIYGKECDYINMDTEKDEEGNDIYIYNFTNKEGIPFSVYSYSTHFTIDASVTNFYQKAISNNYVRNVFEAHREELMECFKDYSFDAECTDYISINIYLDSYTQLPEVAELIVEADEVLGLEYNKDGYDGHGTSDVSVAVFLKPDSTERNDEWKEQYGNRISYIYLSSDKEERWKLEDAYTVMERKLVDGIKQGKYGQYQLTEDILYKYSAPWIYVTSVNGNSSIGEIYAFEYDVESDQYWMSKLDPCQDFEEFPYNYSKQGSFARLVELLNGTYRCEDWIASWEIGENKWKAKLKTDTEDGYMYENMIIKLNGKKIKLSNPGERNNGTASGRSYTVEDLEAMLNVDIEIDQVSMTATIMSRTDE